MKVFHKNVCNRSELQIKKEVEFQIKASTLGLCPKIIITDYKTYIDMEDLEEMCIADMYGEDISTMPNHILDQIYTIIVRLYLECDIEYIDITPYNFIEKDNKIWIIDFGDAREAAKKDWFLKELFINKKVLQWNPDFR